MEISKFIVEKIKRRMKALGMNQAGLATATGVSNSMVTMWLSGEHNFTIYTLQKIQNALNISFFAYSENEVKCFPCDTVNVLKKWK